MTIKKDCAATREVLKGFLTEEEYQKEIERYLSLFQDEEVGGEEAIKKYKDFRAALLNEVQYELVVLKAAFAESLIE